MNTQFASRDNYKKGCVTAFADNVKHYAFSNIYEVANAFKPYQKVAVAKNMQYIIEAIPTERQSGWFAASHDEFALLIYFDPTF